MEELNQNKIVYSIVIPHYNDVDSLKVLLSSIPDRDDIQIIVVDDNTYEDIQQLSVQLEDIDRRFELYNNTTHVNSAGTCRNIGLEHAKGKWLLFADADDWFVEGAFEVLDRYQECKADLVVFLPVSVNLPEMTTGVRHLDYEWEIKNYLRDPDNDLGIRYRIRGPVSKLVRNEIVRINKITFDSVKWSNDVMFSMKIGFYANRVIADKQTIYCITRKKGTLTSDRSTKEYQSRYDVQIKRWLFLNSILGEKKTYEILGWPGAGVASAIIGGYGLSTAKKILEKYRRNNIKIGIKGLSIDFFLYVIVNTKCALRDKFCH